MRHRAVIFDLDGTLLDTLEDIAGAVNKALSQLALPQHEVDAYRYFVGEGMEALASHALPQSHRDTTMVNDFVVRINEEYSKRWSNKTYPYQCIPDLLDALTIAGVKMSILSNKPQRLTEVMASKLLSQWHFELVIGASPSISKKPDPTVALQIAEQLNINPSEILFLGDSGIDMKTAVGAGMYPVGALWGFRPAEELLLGGAKALIKRPNELIRLL